MSDVILRKFWLENETGDSIPLNGERGIWLIDPTGLGITNNSSFTNFSNGFFKPVDADKDPQQTVAGDLYFIDPIDPYVQYRRFIDWITESQTLYLVYSPITAQYRRKIRFSTISKEELLTQESLKCPIAMYGLTPWFTKTEHTIPAMEETNEYAFVVEYNEEPPFEESEEPLILDGGESETPNPLETDLINRSRLGDGNPEHASNYARLQLDNRFRASTEIFTRGQKASGFIIKHTGLLVNPAITVRGSGSNSNYGQCRVSNITINSDETLYYISDYGGSGIIKMGQFGMLDLIDFVEDLGHNIYPKLPQNQFSTVELSSDKAITSKTEVTLIEYYKGV